MSLQNHSLLAGINWERKPAAADSGAHCRRIEIGAHDYPWGTRAGLTRRQQLVLDKPDRRHLADAQLLDDFVQNQLTAFCTLTLAIARNMVLVAECTDPRLGPGMSFRRPSSGAVEKRSDGAVRQNSREFRDDPLSLHVGLPAVFATLLFPCLEHGVIAPLPVQKESEPATVDRDHDFTQHSAQDALSDRRRCCGMVPKGGQIVAQRDKLIALLCGHATLSLIHCGGKLGLTLGNDHQTIVPTTLQLRRDQPVVRI